MAGWAVAAVLAALAGWLAWRPAPTPPPVSRYSILLPSDQLLAAVRGTRVSLAPDGSRLVADIRGKAWPGIRLLGDYEEDVQLQGGVGAARRANCELPSAPTGLFSGRQSAGGHSTRVTVTEARVSRPSVPISPSGFLSRPLPEPSGQIVP